MGVGFATGGAVLQPGPVGDRRHQPVVADALDLEHLVPSLPRLPVPAAVHARNSVLVVEFDSPVDVRECDRRLPPPHLPERRMPHHQPIRPLRCQAFVKSGPSLAPVSDFTAAAARQQRIAGGIQKLLRAPACQPTGPDTLCHHGGDAPRIRGVHFDLDHAFMEQKVLAGIQQLHFPRVFEDLRRLAHRGAPADRTQQSADVSQHRILAHVRAAAQPHAHLRAVATSTDAAILHQQHLHAQPFRADRRAQPGIAAAANQQIVFHRVFLDDPRGPESTKLAAGRRVVGRDVLGIRRQVDGVASAVEAGQVAKRQPMRPSLHRPRAAGLPCPVAAVRAELGIEGAPVDQELETPGRRPAAPGAGPVARSHEDMPAPGFGQRERRGGIGHGVPEAVRHDVGRSHRLGALRVDDPAAEIVERLRFDQHKCHGGPPGVVSATSARCPAPSAAG